MTRNPFLLQRNILNTMGNSSARRRIPQPDGAFFLRYDGNRYEGNRYKGNRYDGNRYDGNRYDGNRYDGNRYDGNRYDGNRYDGNLLSNLFQTFLDSGMNFIIAARQKDKASS